MHHMGQRLNDWGHQQFDQHKGHWQQQQQPQQPQQQQHQGAGADWTPRHVPYDVNAGKQDWCSGWPVYAAQPDTCVHHRPIQRVLL